MPHKTSLLAALIVALALVLAPAALAKGSGGGPIVVHELKPGASKLSRTEMRRAEPLPLPTLPGNPSAGATAAGDSAAGADGKPKLVEGYVPPNIAIAGATRRAGTSARGFGSFTSRAVVDPVAYPNSTNGKVFGTIPGIGTFTCSASVVRAKNLNTLFTAGHCVKEPRGKYVSSLTFVPSYSEGVEPFGRWEASKVAVKRSWARKGNSNFDYATVVVKPSLAGNVEDVVGSQGFAYNMKPKKKTFRAVGYPFNKFDTEVMWECIDRFARYDPGYLGPGPKPIGIGCDMLGGASGGGWTLPGTYLNSVTSFGYDSLPNALFGPYFNKATEKLRKAASRTNP
jgi:V8-like Glu-specific endopeptidase